MGIEELDNKAIAFLNDIFFMEIIIVDNKVNSSEECLSLLAKCGQERTGITQNNN